MAVEYFDPELQRTKKYAFKVSHPPGDAWVSPGDRGPDAAAQ